MQRREVSPRVSILHDPNQAVRGPCKVSSFGSCLALGTTLFSTCLTRLLCGACLCLQRRPCWCCRPLRWPCLCRSSCWGMPSLLLAVLWPSQRPLMVSHRQGTPMMIQDEKQCTDSVNGVRIRDGLTNCWIWWVSSEMCACRA